MHVIFVEPCFPGNQSEFVRALSEVGAYVTGIGEVPPEAVPSRIRGWMGDYVQVSSVVNEGAMLEAVKSVQAKGWVDRLEATVEAHILPVAKVREACGIPGTSVETAFLCRDKPAMKEALRKADVSTALSAGVSSPAEVREFVAQVGYPIILKPRSGAGAAGTQKVDNDEELEAAILEQGLDKGHSVAAEEFVEGHEAFYDTLCIDGQPVHEFISHYYPGVLDSMRTRWISPYLVTTNRMDASAYDEVKTMGRRVIEALGIGTSASHMEWFYGPKGLKFSEIGCRPPGVQVWDLYSLANDFDLYIEWASAITRQKPVKQASRRFSAGMINIRPDRDGIVVGYEGWEQVERAYGEWIIDYHLPPPGARTMPVEAGYMANAWIRMRHPDYDEMRSIFDDIGKTLKMRARAD